MEIQQVKDVTHSLLTSPTPGLALQIALRAKGVSYPVFVDALAKALEQNPSPLQLTEDETISLLNRIKSPVLRSPSVLKKISPASRN